MSQESSDFFLGVFGLLVFLIFVFVGGKLLYSFKNSRLTKAWAPLQPVINGAITGDGGGAATSRLTGTYKGRRVQASMSPNVSSGESNVRYNYFDISVVDVPGRSDWSVVCETPFLGFGRAGWRVEAGDKALEEALLNFGIISLVEGLGVCEVRYLTYAQTLRYSVDAGSCWVPPPDRFVEELELLLRLVAVNEKVNAHT